MSPDNGTLNTHAGEEIATLAGGCFWCLEAVYAEVDGVSSVVSGYMGGETSSPSYKDVCTGQTGHAEVVRLTYDPQAVSYRELLDIFFAIHDPTTPNRQGNDIGSQYRSAIFYHTETQKAEATALIGELGQAGVWNDPVITEVVPATTFYPAEEYHQNYYQTNPYQPYCQFVVAPKVNKFRTKYGHLRKPGLAAT